MILRYRISVAAYANLLRPVCDLSRSNHDLLGLIYDHFTTNIDKCTTFERSALSEIDSPAVEDRLKMLQYQPDLQTSYRRVRLW